VPTAFPDPYPPQLEPYLHNPAVTSKIGSKSVWQDSNLGIYYQFASTGDWMRSSRPALETVINAGVRTVIYDGDADYICNYMGVEAMVRARLPRFSFSSDPSEISTFALTRVSSLCFICFALRRSTP